MKRGVVFLIMMLLIVGSLTPSFSHENYTVKPGDVLWKIADEHNITLEQISKLNGIDDPNMIVAGQVLNVASPETSTNSQTVKEDNKVKLVAGKNKVKFYSEGEEIVALLFIPEDYVQGEKRPAIIITPPASGVKEQTAGLYAEKLSKEGFVTLAFDPRGWGESEGHRSLFDPYKIVDDTKASISYIISLKQVDTDNVFNMGICMGAGISAYSAIYDTRINALAMVSPYIDLKDTFFAQVGGAENFRTAINIVSKAEQKYFATGEDTFRKMVPETEEEMAIATPVGIGMMEYYLPGKPGSVPNWRNEQSLLGTTKMLSFSIFDHMNMFNAMPTFVAYGDEAITKDGAIRFIKESDGTVKDMVFNGAGHFDLYWMPEYVDPIVKVIVDFFKKNMK